MFAFLLRGHSEAMPILIREICVMGSLAMYLEGPGSQRRSVQVLSSQRKRLHTGSVDSINIRNRSISEVEVKTLVDEHGQIAVQTDYDGFLFKYPNSEIPWSLIVG